MEIIVLNSQKWERENEQMAHHAFTGFQVGSKWHTIAWANIWNQNDPILFV